MKTYENSKEIQLVFILCKLAVAQMQMPIPGNKGLSNLLAGKTWKNSTVEEKHNLLQMQYEMDFYHATANEKKYMAKIRKSIMSELATL